MELSGRASQGSAPQATNRGSRIAVLRAAGLTALLGALLGSMLACGSGGGMSLIAISPTSAQTLDGGQSLAVIVSVINDSSHSGAAIVLNGPGTLTTQGNSLPGDSDQYNLTYTAPATVTAGTTATITATARNTPSQVASVTITLNPALAIATTTLPTGAVQTAYTSAIAFTGGTAPVRLSIASGTFPPGLAINPVSGAISGTPTAFGTYNFTIAATDSSTTPTVVTQAYSLLINALSPTVTTTSLPNAVAGVAYTQQLAYQGGNNTTPAWAMTAGSLPPGITLSSAGVVSGTASVASAGMTFTFSVTVTVGPQTSPAAQITLTVPALPAVATASLPTGNIGVPYSQQLAFTGGGGGTVTWAITAGSLPAASGLTLSSAGLLSGTPTSAATYSFSVVVTVGTQTSPPQAFTLTINSLVISSANTAIGEVALPFAFHLTAAGGTAPYTWSLAAGSAALPAGLSLNATTGLIGGSPTAAAGSPFGNIIVMATDSVGATATQTMTFTVNTARGSANSPELSGQYAFLLSGFDAGGKPLALAGKFTADGAGHISGGVVDENGTALAAAQTNITLTASTYAVGSDNRGQITLTTASGSTTYVLALNGVTSGIATGGYMTEFDATGQSLSGALALETPSAFTTASIAGGFAFGLDGFAANSTAAQRTHRADIGEVQFTGSGTITGAEMLMSGSGSTTPIVPTSAVLAVGSNGRGSLTFVLPNGGGSMDLAVYVVSATRLYLISIDPASGSSGAKDLVSGQALAQTIPNGSFVTGSLNATSVVRMEKLGIGTPGAYYSDAQIGLLTFAGTGKLSLSTDENAAGIATTNSEGGTYAVAANGRTTAYIAPTGLGGCTDCVSVQTFFYLVGANQGFLMDFTGGVTSGYFEPQTATSFSASSFNGSYSLGTLDPLLGPATLNSGIAVSTGAGSVSATLDEETSGTLTPDVMLTTAYTVGTTGRVALTPSAGSSPVLYIISPAKALLLDVAAPSPVVEEVLHQ